MPKPYHIFIQLTVVFVLFIYAAAQDTPFQPGEGEKGSVSGKVIAGDTGEPVFGALISVKGTQEFQLSDINGDYKVNNVPAGSNTIVFDSDDHETFESRIFVNAGENTTVSVKLSPKKEEAVERKRIRGVSVKAARVSGSEAALLSKRRKSVVVQDAIGSEQISKSPDSDAGDAARRVTGITIVDDNIYIRGLGERYTSVLLGKSTVPSPDPDKRVVPLDIFPVGLLDSLTIMKTFSPEMPGEFCGGVIQIQPKDYPAERFFKISVGTGVELDALPFKSKYYTYQGGERDWLGYDDGTRALPADVPEDEIVMQHTITNWDKLEKIAESFPYIFTPYQTNTPLPLKLSVSYGDTFDIFKNGKFGFLLSGMYKNGVSTESKDKTAKAWDGTLQKRYSNTTYTRYVKNGALISLGFAPTIAHKFRSTSFYSHNADDDVIVEYGQSGLEDRIYKKYTLNYINNTLFFSQLNGTHYFKNLNNILLLWTGAFGKALRNEPDKRGTFLETPPGDINPASDQYQLEYMRRVIRSYLDHTEDNISANVEIQVPYRQWFDLNSRLYVGGDYTKKERYTFKRRFQYQAGNNLIDQGEPIENFINDENVVGYTSSGDHIWLREDTQVDSYSGLLKIISAYAKTDLPVFDKLKISGGLRYENSYMEMNKIDIYEQTTNLMRDDVLTRHNYLPSVNIIFSPISKINVRTSYSKSIARPDFREAIDISWELNEGGIQVFGNPDLEQVNVHSVDFRFEFYPSELEIFSISGFYKYIQNPIELLQLATLNVDELKYQYQNGDFAHNTGVEVEVRKDFGFITRNLKDLYIGANVALIKSTIHVSDKPASVYSQTERPMQGQSPYVANATLGYQNEDLGITTTLLFNMVGKRISSVTIVPTAEDRGKSGDTYDVPAPELDFVYKQSFLKNHSVKFALKNILDMESTSMRDDEILSKKRKGRSISLSYSLKF